MWGGVSQLDVPYEVRHMMRFKDKHQRPLTDREKEIIARVKAESKTVKGRPEIILPNIKVSHASLDLYLLKQRKHFLVTMWLILEDSL